MAGARDVGELRVWHHLQELACAFLAEQVAGASADEQRGHAERACIALQASWLDQAGAGLVGDRAPTDEAGVPVPDPASVSALAHVLAQARQVGRPGPVRVVGGDGVGDLSQAGEPVWIGGHEGSDALPPFHLDAVSDVDQHERAARGVVGLGYRRHGGNAAETGSDERGRAFERVGDGDDVAGESVERVVAVARPLALAMPAHVDGVGSPPASASVVAVPCHECLV